MDQSTVDVVDAGKPNRIADPRTRRHGPATRVLSGALADPLLTSLGRDWNGLTLELHEFHSQDVVVQSRDHVIAVHLAGNVQVEQTRGGRRRSRTLNSGCVSVTPAGPPTRWRQSGHSVVLLLRLSPAHTRTVAGDAYAAGGSSLEIRSSFGARDATIESLGKQLLAAMELEGADGRLCADTLICELALRLLREYRLTAAAPKWVRAKLSPTKLRRAMEYIDDNLHNNLTLSAIATAVALSPSHFAHAFREAKGVAPHHYVVGRRVERAKEMLRDSELSITEIADRVGCSSQSHFAVLFRRITGITPRQFRSQD